MYEERSKLELLARSSLMLAVWSSIQVHASRIVISINSLHKRAFLHLQNDFAPTFFFPSSTSSSHLDITPHSVPATESLQRFSLQDVIWPFCLCYCYVSSEHHGFLTERDPRRDGGLRRGVDWYGRYGQDVRREAVCCWLEVSMDVICAIASGGFLYGESSLTFLSPIPFMMTRAHLARALFRAVWLPFRRQTQSCALNDVNACYLNKLLSESLPPLPICYLVSILQTIS